MGQKTSPISMRLGIVRTWESRWFGGKKYRSQLAQDMQIREFLQKKIKNMSVDHVDIERTPTHIVLGIYTARPGLIIGRGGSGIEELKNELKKKVPIDTTFKIDIHEFKEPETSASIMAESMAEQIEKRMPFRRVMKQTLGKITANKTVAGAKLQVAGRLNGAEIARSETVKEGSMPLQTLKENIDFSKATAVTTYGTIGVKVWIHKRNEKQKV